MSTPIPIEIGTEPNDGTGTPLRDAMDIINGNFNDVFGRGQVSVGTEAPDPAVFILWIDTSV